jgi:DNA-binding response OmpR family regulator
MRLLLVEDELGLADSLSSILMKENYIVDHCSDGESGYYAAMSNIYDIIILDVMIPILDGFEILKKLREENISTPVLILTAKSDTTDMVTGLDNGADDYLTKPFVMEELLARLRALGRRQGEILTDIHSFHDLELYPSKCLIMCTTTGKSVNISQKELQMLESLMIHKHQILTKEQLTLKTWGYDNQAEYNNVEVYISFTRKKISFIGSQTKIKAIRGVGYTLEE